MNYPALHTAVIAKKAMINYGKKNGIKLYQSKLTVIYACCMLHKKSIEITGNTLVKSMARNKTGVSPRSVRHILLALEKEGLLTSRNGQRRGFQTKIYNTTVKMQLLLNGFELFLRKTRVSDPAFGYDNKPAIRRNK